MEKQNFTRVTKFVKDNNGDEVKITRVVVNEKKELDNEDAIQLVQDTNQTEEEIIDV